VLAGRPVWLFSSGPLGTESAAPHAAHRVIVMSNRSDVAIAAPDQPRADAF
jgi:hypothetical protein